MAGVSRAPSVSPTLLQTKSLWGEGRRLLGRAPQAGCVREHELVWTGALEGPAGRWSHGRRASPRTPEVVFQFWVPMHPGWRLCCGKSKRCPARAGSPRPESSLALSSLYSCPQPGRRGAEGSRAGRDTPARGSCRCDSGHSAALVSRRVRGRLVPPRTGRDGTEPQVSSRLYVAWPGHRGG